MRRKIRITGIGKTLEREVPIRNIAHLRAQQSNSAFVIQSKKAKNRIPRKTKHRVNLTKKYR